MRFREELPEAISRGELCWEREVRRCFLGGLNIYLVQGLSILLFAAAFMGNLFYVLSILSSPLVEEDESKMRSITSNEDRHADHVC